MISIFFISMSSINTMYFHQGAAEGFLTSKDKFLKPTDLIPVAFAVSGKYTNSTDFHENHDTKFKTLTGIGNPSDIAINPVTNKFYVSKQDDNVVCVFDGKTNNLLANITVGESPHAIAVNPNTNKVYVANYDNSTVSVIDGKLNRVIKNLTISKYEAPESIAVNPNTNKVYVADPVNSTINIFDGKTNNLVSKVTVGKPETSHELAVNPNTNMVYVTDRDSHNITVVDGLSDRILTHVLLGDNSSSIAINQQSNMIYVANFDSHRVYVIDGKTNRVIDNIVVPKKFVLNVENPSIAINPSTNYLYLVDGDANTISVIDSKANNVTNTFQVTGHPSSIAINPITDMVYLANVQSDSISIFDSKTNSIPLEKNNTSQSNQAAPAGVGIKVGIKPVGIAVNPNTDMVYVANYVSNTVSVIDGNKDILIDTIKVGRNPYSVAVDTITNRIFVTSIGTNSTTVIDGSSNKILDNITLKDRPGSLAVDSADRLLYVTTLNSDSIYVINSDTNKVIGSLNVGGRYQSSIAVDPYTHHVYVTHMSSDNGLSHIHESKIFGNRFFASSFVGNFLGNRWLKDVGINPVTNTLYVAQVVDGNYEIGGTGDIHIIDGYTFNERANFTIIIPVPVKLAINSITDRIYVVRELANTPDIVSVLNDRTNKWVANVTLSEPANAFNSASFIPADLAINPKTNMVYVTGPDSDKIYELDGSTNSLLSNIHSNINPSDAGSIVCNQKEIQNNEYIKFNIGSLNCHAQANNGFIFTSWSGSLTSNMINTIPKSKISGSLFDKLLELLYPNNHNDNSHLTLAFSQPGNLTANFRQIPPPIPPEYWVGLYGVMVSSIIGWFVPNIASWINAKRKKKHMRKYIDRIEEVNTSDQHLLMKEITSLYARGKISEDQFRLLKDMISDKTSK
jgi:YVTN family beta-propeller protein